ncbi:glutathione S-transferase theta-1a [Genypterus blacodes]|uniref:glutathione S-transferase theta-1a n=1 Tax=Genypterus blacodes TaxID=154954 RepID=UPI003F75F242
MELYLDLHSPPARAVFLFAKIAGIPFEFKLVDLTAGQQHSEEYGKISMVRKVPVMKDGSFILTESVAILKYLVQKHASSVADHWYPAELQQRARVNEFLSWQHMNFKMHCSKVFWFRSVAPVLSDCGVPKEKMDSALEDLTQSLNMLEQKFLQDKRFIVDDRVSLADLMALVDLMQPYGTGLDVFEGRPKLSAWRDRVKEEIGEELFNEAHHLKMDMKTLAEAMTKSGMLELLKVKLQKVFN